MRAGETTPCGSSLAPAKRTFEQVVACGAPAQATGSPAKRQRTTTETGTAFPNPIPAEQSPSPTPSLQLTSHAQPAMTPDVPQASPATSAAARNANVPHLEMPPPAAVAGNAVILHAASHTPPDELIPELPPPTFAACAPATLQADWPHSQRKSIAEVLEEAASEQVADPLCGLLTAAAAAPAQSQQLQLPQHSGTMVYTQTRGVFPGRHAHLPHYPPRPATNAATAPPPPDLAEAVPKACLPKQAPPPSALHVSQAAATASAAPAQTQHVSKAQTIQQALVALEIQQQEQPQPAQAGPDADTG